MKRRER